MQNTTTNDTQQRQPRPRVKSACERCRRQKLGCDRARPCAMCVRSGSECIPKTGPPRTRKPKRSQRNASSEVSSQLHEQPNHAPQAPSCAAHSSPMLPSPTTRDGSVATEDDPPDTEDGYTPYAPGSSIADLTIKILNQHQSGLGCHDDIFALPGGSGSAAGSPDQARAAPLRDLVGLELPPRHVTDFLVDTYFGSVHWFMMILDEPSFRDNYNRIISSRVACQSEIPFVILLMMVLAMAAHYATKRAIHERCPDFDLQSLQRLLLVKVKQYMYELYDEACLEAVQITILLGSFYLYNAKPNLAFAILGAGIKCAQAMGLHLESSWKTQSEKAREIQRHTWWELFVFDRFASIVFGKPCSIKYLDCHVRTSEGLNATSPQHPDYQSTELTEEGVRIPVTLFTYQRTKYRLYRIMSPVLENMNLLHANKKTQLIEDINRIHQQLVSWHASLPDELRLNTGSNMSDNPSGVVQSTFKMQALALQLAYDNIMVVLHRPLLLAVPKVSAMPHSQDEGNETLQDAAGVSTALQKAHSTSKNRCWESAMRTASVVKHIDALQSMKTSHAASYAGMHFFTAGVMLSVVAMSQPVSRKAEEAKRAIGGIIRLLKAFGPHTVLSAQSGSIMERLLRLIMNKEMAALVSGPHSSQLNALMLQSRQASPFHDHAQAQLQDTEPNNQSLINEAGKHQQDMVSEQHEPDSMLIDESQTFSDPFGFTDFNTGMLYVQELFRSAPIHNSAFDSNNMMRSVTREDQPGNGLGQDEAPTQVTTSGPEYLVPMYGHSLGGLQDHSQMWLWDTDPKFY